MNNYKYSLEPYKGMNTRYNCPQCKGIKTFTKYIEIETNEHIADHVGRCNKLDKCSYHYKPKQFFDANTHLLPTYKEVAFKPLPPLKPIFTVPIQLLDATLTNYDNNNFALILLKLFGYDDAVKLLKHYEIGTSQKYNGSTIFWQIDAKGIVRTGKTMLYNIETLKRCKEPHNRIKWAHSPLIDTNTHQLKQCFFGEHLINQFKTKPITIVESEKTAIICSHFYPQYNWLGAGNINGLSIDKFKVLKGRKVILFPDLNKGFDIWQQKANEFKNIADVSISNYLERIATNEQKADGLDLADYLINSVGSVANVA